jgi:hypothetical protein
MSLSGIQIYQAFKEWIPDQNRFGNDRFGLYKKQIIQSKQSRS